MWVVPSNFLFCSRYINVTLAVIFTSYTYVIHTNSKLQATVGYAQAGLVCFLVRLITDVKRGSSHTATLVHKKSHLIREYVQVLKWGIVRLQNSFYYIVMFKILCYWEKNLAHHCTRKNLKLRRQLNEMSRCLYILSL